jgi:hypothetical protein
MNYTEGGSRARNLEQSSRRTPFQPLLLSFTCLKPHASSILRLTVFAGVYEHRWSINLQYIAKNSTLLGDLGSHGMGLIIFAYAR